METKEYNGKWSAVDLKRVVAVLSNLMSKNDVEKMLSELNAKTTGMHNAAMNKAYFLFERVMDDPACNRRIHW